MTDLALATSFPTASEAAWRAIVEKSLKGAEFEDELVSRTLDGLRIEPLYTRSVPGTGQAGRTGPWRIVSSSASADPARVNAEILADLAGGADAIELRLAAPGLAGIPLRHDAIGRALAGVHLDMVHVAVASGDQYLGALQSLLAHWDEAGIAGARRQGALDADPLGHLARTGALESELWATIDVLGHLVAQNIDLSPNLTLLSADGRPYHEAGASEAQELAIVLATAVEYLKALEREGVEPAEGLPTIRIALATDADFLLGIAKLRAARTLIARLADVCGAAAVASHVRFHAETSRRMMSKLDPHVNILRATIACASAGLGGADSIAVVPHTAVNGLPDAHARRIARNVQVVLMEESSLARVADPAGGSFALETLTRELGAKAWSLFQEIEAKGGMAEALASGFIADGISRVAEARGRLIADKKMPLTGVTSFAAPATTRIGAEPLPAAATIEQAATRIAPLKLRRPAEPYEVQT